MMDTHSLEAVAQHLEKRQSAIVAKSNELRTMLATLDEEFARIQSAVAALRGTAIAAMPAKPPKKDGEKKLPTAPAVSRARVIELMAATLQQQGTIQKEELKATIEKLVVADGFSRMCYALRFKEALADARFVSVGDEVSLRRRAVVTTSSAETQVADDLPQLNGHPSHPQSTLQT